MTTLWEMLMDADSSVGFFIIIAFLLGAGLQHFPGKKKLGDVGSTVERVLSLLEAIASHQGHDSETEKEGEDTKK